MTLPRGRAASSHERCGPMHDGADRYPERIFPVPIPASNSEERPGRQLSRVCRQRWARRRREEQRVQRCFKSLNWMAGAESTYGAPTCRLHEEVVEHVRRCVGKRPEPKAYPTPEEAARALLRARAEYEPDAGVLSVTPYQADLLSLPESVHGATYADELGCKEVSDLLARFEQCQLRSQEELAEVAVGTRTPYMDRVLAEKPREYTRFVQSLWARELIIWSTTPKERTSPHPRCAANEPPLQVAAGCVLVHVGESREARVEGPGHHRRRGPAGVGDGAGGRP